MTDITKLKIKDFLELADAATQAQSRVVMIRTALARHEDETLADKITRQLLSREEIAFAEKNYYLDPNKK